MKNTTKNVLVLVLLVAALVMQILPYGAVLRFPHPDGATTVSTYSYFDITPYGYANFAPLFCGITTALWLLVSLISLILKRTWQTARTVIGYIAFILALLPVTQGPVYMNIWGWGIAILLCAALFLTKKPHRPKKDQL